jgi:hypothetical protein
MYITLEEYGGKEHYKPLTYVTCDIKGGLGNQLFMIFTTLAYAMDNGYYAWFTETSSYGDRPSYWKTFFKSLRVYLSSHVPIHHYKEPEFKYNPIPKGMEELDGYFQSELYFKSHANEIIEQMNISEFQYSIQSRFNMTQPIRVSLHFRIGDYVKFPNHHPILPLSYYQNALSMLEQKIKKPFTVYCFYEKQDEATATSMIEALNIKDKILVPTLGDIQDWEEMICMSCCHHHIIANSSFSWWGAYLNSSKEKLVYYPSVWFGSALAYDTSDLCPKEWIRI